MLQILLDLCSTECDRKAVLQRCLMTTYDELTANGNSSGQSKPSETADAAVVADLQQQLADAMSDRDRIRDRMAVELSRAHEQQQNSVRRIAQLEAEVATAPQPVSQSRHCCSPTCHDFRPFAMAAGPWPWLYAGHSHRPWL